MIKFSTLLLYSFFKNELLKSLAPEITKSINTNVDYNILVETARMDRYLYP